VTPGVVELIATRLALAPALSEFLDSRFSDASRTINLKEANVFVELMPLLKDRTLLLTVARADDKVKVNVIPVKAREGDDHALTTPLSYTALPAELDLEFGKHLASYVESHLALSNTLAEAKAEMDAAAKAARQKAKSTQAPKTEVATAKKQEALPSLAREAESTLSLFAGQPQATESQGASTGEERKTS
jgi:PRTRC genetic system protein E